MSGPTASVDLPCLLTDADLAVVSAMIDSISGHRDGNDFWAATTVPIGGRVAADAGRPFVVIAERVGEEEKEEPDNEVARASDVVEAAFGFRPVQSLGFVAMCNDDEDHRVLGELCPLDARSLRRRDRLRRYAADADAAVIAEAVVGTGLGRSAARVRAGCLRDARPHHRVPPRDDARRYGPGPPRGRGVPPGVARPPELPHGEVAGDGGTAPPPLRTVTRRMETSNTNRSG